MVGGWVAGRVVGWSLGRLVGWFVGWFVGWILGWTDGRAVDITVTNDDGNGIALGDVAVLTMGVTTLVTLGDPTGARSVGCAGDGVAVGAQASTNRHIQTTITRTTSQAVFGTTKIIAQKSQIPNPKRARVTVLW